MMYRLIDYQLIGVVIGVQLNWLVSKGRGISVMLPERQTEILQVIQSGTKVATSACHLSLICILSCFFDWFSCLFIIINSSYSYSSSSACQSAWFVSLPVCSLLASLLGLPAYHLSLLASQLGLSACLSTAHLLFANRIVLSLTAYRSWCNCTSSAHC